MINITLLSVALVTASVSADNHLLLPEGSVACRSKAALQTMREAGGYEKLPEFLIGTACFRLSSTLHGRILSVDDSGAVEVSMRQRRMITQPPSLWIEERRNSRGS